MVVTWQVRKSANQCNVYSNCFVIIEIAVFLGASLGLVVLCGLVVLRVTDSQNCCDIGVSVEMHSVATTFARDVAPWAPVGAVGQLAPGQESWTPDPYRIHGAGILMLTFGHLGYIDGIHVTIYIYIAYI